MGQSPNVSDQNVAATMPHVSREHVEWVVLMLGMVLMWGCGGPTTPSCTDQYGRGSSNSNTVTLSSDNYTPTATIMLTATAGD